MTLNDILTLSRAGFTAQQISALASVATPAPAAQAPAAQAPATPAPATPAPAAQAPATPAPATPAPATATDTQKILEQLGIISNQVTSANIAGSNLPANSETTETILASIIAPPKQN